MGERIIPGTYVKVRPEGLIMTRPTTINTIGIIGTSSKGPIGEPVLLTQYKELIDNFGDEKENLTLLTNSALMYSNGASLVYGIRIASTDASEGEVLLGNNAATPVDALKLIAKEKGSWSKDISIRVTNDTTITTIKILYKGGVEEFSGETVEDIANAINNETIGSSLVNAEVELGHEADILGDANYTLSEGNDGGNVDDQDYIDALELFESENVHIVLCAGQDSAAIHAKIQEHVTNMAELKKERIGIVGGALAENVNAIKSRINAIRDGRMVFVSNGVKVVSRVDGSIKLLSPACSASIIAGLMASNRPQDALTHMQINGVYDVERKWTVPQLRDLIKSGSTVINEENGVIRIEKGVTTALNTDPFYNLAIRRITDFAVYSSRNAGNPYIGKLNNSTTRASLKSSMDVILGNMVREGALISFDTNVYATREDEIKGRCYVDLRILPTYSIDYIEVTIFLE